MFTWSGYFASFTIILVLQSCSIKTLHEYLTLYEIKNFKFIHRHQMINLNLLMIWNCMKVTKKHDEKIFFPR